VNREGAQVPPHPLDRLEWKRDDAVVDETRESVRHRPDRERRLVVGVGSARDGLDLASQLPSRPSALPTAEPRSGSS